MTSVVRLTCLAAMAALALGACTPKSSGNAGPSFVDSGAPPVDARVDRGNDAGASDAAASDTSANPDTGGDAAGPDLPADAPVTADAPADTTGDAGPGDTGSPDARDSAGSPDARDSAGDLGINLDLRDALLIDLGADARDGGG